MALLAVAGVAELARRKLAAGASPVDVLSYFTVQGNLVAAVALAWTAFGGGQTLTVGEAAAPSSMHARDILRDLLRGASVLMLLVTAGVRATLLDGQWDWVDTTLHAGVPAAVTLDWLLAPPAGALRLRHAAGWACIPVAFLGYTLLRGHLVGWYPYPFLDPGAVGGYGAVALRALAVAGGVAVAAAALVWSTWLGRAPGVPGGAHNAGKP